MLRREDLLLLLLLHHHRRVQEGRRRQPRQKAGVLHRIPGPVAAPSITPPLTSRYRIAMAQLAEHLVQRHSGLSHTNEWPKLGAACLRLLEIDESQVDAIFAESVPILDAEE